MLVVLQSTSLIAKHAKTLLIMSLIDIKKKYAGSVIGPMWIILQPLILLMIYLFVYLVIFKVKFPGYSEFSYVLFIFSGLVPYLGLMDSLSNSAMVLKQNAHMRKAVLLPLELIPVKALIVSLIPQMVSISILLFLAVLNESLGVNTLMLPLVILGQILFLQGLVWISSVIGLIISDYFHFLNLFLLFLMFISPIGFKREMVPQAYQLLIDLNPIYYMATAFRFCFLGGTFETFEISVFFVLSIALFVIGARFFAKSKDFISDYE